MLPPQNIVKSYDWQLSYSLLETHHLHLRNICLSTERIQYSIRPCGRVKFQLVQENWNHKLQHNITFETKLQKPRKKCWLLMRYPQNRSPTNFLDLQDLYCETGITVLTLHNQRDQSCLSLSNQLTAYLSLLFVLFSRCFRLNLWGVSISDRGRGCRHQTLCVSARVVILGGITGSQVKGEACSIKTPSPTSTFPCPQLKKNMI